MGSITRSFANNILTAGKFDGTKLTGDIPTANLTANAPAFDDDKVVNDLATLGLRVHTQENLTASNTNSQYVDVFQDTSGYTNGANTLRDSNEFISTVSISAGSYETGNRTSTYTLTMPDITIQGGTLSNLVNGSYATGNSSTGFYWTVGTNSSGDKINFDLGGGNSKVYVGARWKQDSTDEHGTWKWQGSNDNANFTDLSSNFGLGGQNTFEEQ